MFLKVTVTNSWIDYTKGESAYLPHPTQFCSREEGKLALYQRQS